MKAQYIATFQPDGATHGICDGWSYDRITDARTVCGKKGPFTVEHLDSGNALTITCRNCARTNGDK